MGLGLVQGLLRVRLGLARVGFGCFRFCCGASSVRI